MSNDIQNNHINIKANSQNAKTLNSSMSPKNTKDYDVDDKSMRNSLNFLGTLGYAQVNMGNCIKKSVEDYLENQDYVEAHTEFCDDLVNKGYPLEKAIIVTDNVFKTLQDKNTYPED